jgi:hypothetical protein
MQLLTDKEKDEISISEWPSTRKLLIRELVELAKIPNYKPFFPPYGRYDPMLYDTALTTIDLISNPLPNSLAPTVVDILSEIVNNKIDRGIPYNPTAESPDIGLSAYLLAVTVRSGFLESLHNQRFASELVDACTNIAYFIMENFQKPEYRYFTYCDTFSNLLLAKP